MLAQIPILCVLLHPDKRDESVIENVVGIIMLVLFTNLHCHYELSVASFRRSESRFAGLVHFVILIIKVSKSLHFFNYSLNRIFFSHKGTEAQRKPSSWNFVSLWLRGLIVSNRIPKIDKDTSTMLKELLNDEVSPDCYRDNRRR